jgi:o-succinylbenzoate---CoA ligase
MSHRVLSTLDAGPGSVSAWAAALAAALDGSGPALIPLPASPAAVREALVAAFRPDDGAAPLESEDIALVVPTSGSTGEPKGALLTASALRSSAEATHARLGGPGRWVLALPLTHVAGLLVVVRAIGAAHVPTEVDLGGGFDPQRFAAAATDAALAASADGVPLYVSLVPGQLLRLLDAEIDLSDFSAILLGAAATPESLLRRAGRAGARVVTTYGMSETCGGCVYDGRPLDRTVVDIDSSGRVVVSGPTLFSGYRLRPDLSAGAFDGAGRLVTADLGAFDADGRLLILGRADDMIVSGGENVAPARVEAALAGLADVLSCAVVGVPDPEWGERIVAVAVARPGTQLDLGGLRTATADLLPVGWLPRGLVLVASIPMLAPGKPDRSAVRAIAARDSAEQTVPTEES